MEPNAPTPTLHSRTRRRGPGDPSTGGGMSRLPPFLTVDELAALVRVPPTTIYTWRYKGLAPPAHRWGRFLRFAREDVEDWIRGHRVGQD